jgi:hypothetical protein
LTFFFSASLKGTIELSVPLAEIRHHLTVHQLEGQYIRKYQLSLWVGPELQLQSTLATTYQSLLQAAQIARARHPGLRTSIRRIDRTYWRVNPDHGAPPAPPPPAPPAPAAQEQVTVPQLEVLLQRLLNLLEDDARADAAGN